MRKYIGNITVNPKSHIYENPIYEDFYRALIKKVRMEMAELIAKKHIEEILGVSKANKVAECLFDEEGNPSPNISFDTIVKQRELLISTLKWFYVIINELESKLQILNPQQYAQDLKEKEESDKDNAEEENKFYNQYLQEKPTILPPLLQQELRNLFKSYSSNFDIKKKANRDLSDIRIIGHQQIQYALSYLFAEYIKNPIYKVTDDADARYAIIRKEVHSFKAFILDINLSISNLNEILMEISA